MLPEVYAHFLNRFAFWYCMVWQASCLLDIVGTVMLERLNDYSFSRRLLGGCAIVIHCHNAYSKVRT